MNTLILSTVFFSLLCWLVATIFSDRFAVLNAQFDQFLKYISNHLGWPIFFAGLGITLFFIFIYNEMNLEGIAAVDFLRTAVLTIGTLGGGYGLILATRRQKVLEEQTKQGQDQLFNDRLGRGAEMLGHESMAVRVAGVKVLEDLALTSDQKEIIYEILYKFLQNKAKIKYNLGGDRIGPEDASVKKNWYDIFTTAEALIKINAERVYEINFDNLDLDYFIFPSNIERLIRIHSHFSTLYRSEIYSVILQGRFEDSYLDFSKFGSSDLYSTSFLKSSLRNTEFSFSNLKFVSFEETDQKNASYDYVDCTLTSFKNVKNIHSVTLENIFYQEDFGPRDLPENIYIKGIYAYRWVKQDGKDYRQLIEGDPSISPKDNNILELNLNEIPGRPFSNY